MLIGELGERTGLSVKTLRYYEQVGVVDAAERTPGGYRTYDASAVERLRFVRSAQALGLTLGEIREIVAFRERGQSPCSHVLQVLETRTAEVDRRIRELRRLRSELTALADRAKALDPAACSASTVCHIIPATTGTTSSAPSMPDPAGTANTTSGPLRHRAHPHPPDHPPIRTP